MGITYILANSSKRQYFDPDSIGIAENTKWHGILWGVSGHALAHLLRPNCELQFHLKSWIGDDFFLVSDTGEANRIEQLRPFGTGTEEEWTIVTTQFDDISLNLISLMSLRPELLELFIANAKKSDSMLVSLVNAMTGLDANHLESAIVSNFGNDWPRHYKKALSNSPRSRHRQPMVPSGDDG